MAAATYGFARFFSREPNFEMRFARVVELERSRADVLQELTEPEAWRLYGKFLQRAESSPDRRLVTFYFKNPKRPRKPWQTIYSIDRSEPGTVTLRLQEDSSRKLTSQFERLELRLSVSENALKGEVLGQTRAWQSRLWGRLDPALLGNQLIFVDIERFAGRPGPSPGAWEI